jgi:hypothetical protein
VPVGAVAPTDTHPRPNTTLRCFLSERFNNPEASSPLAGAAQKKNNKKIMMALFDKSPKYHNGHYRQRARCYQLCASSIMGGYDK